MKIWFFSLKGAITLSLLALISELWRGFLDAMFVLPVDFGDDQTMNIAAIIFAVLFAAWGLSIWSAQQGSRRGLVATFIINVLVLIAIPVGWLVFYCPVECRVGSGIFNLANSLNLILGLLAGISLATQIWRTPQYETGLEV